MPDGAASVQAPQSELSEGSLPALVRLHARQSSGVSTAPIGPE